MPELSGILTARYAEYLREPKVSVIVKSIAPVKVFVGGEVAQPGVQRRRQAERECPDR